MFSLSKGQRQQPPNSAASAGGPPASSAVAATSAEMSAAESVTSSTVPSAASIRGAFDKGGIRRARVVRWSGVIERGSGGGNVDRRYCCPCCVGGEGG